MYKFQAFDPLTKEIQFRKVFLNQNEAEQFAVENKVLYPSYTIIPLGSVDGMIYEEPEIEEENEDDFTIEEMGLDEETQEGFDWTLEDKSGD